MAKRLPANDLSPAQPVAHWDFGEEESTPLRAHGGVHRDLPGPRSPEYPDFNPDNTAVKLDGHGAYLSFADTGVQSPFDFTNGDALTLEAWVQLNELFSGENIYVIGKGRTGAPGFSADNQNWALRIRERKGKGSLNFLFATTPEPKSAGDSHWHRWTTTKGFAPGPAWHHIAISYRFGEPESIRGWIDGQPMEGTWDMGGATTRPPVVDNDAVWIGASMGGAASTSLRGSLDSISIYRDVLPEQELKSRFRRVGEEPVAQPAPAVVPQLGQIAPNEVLVTLHSRMPSHDRWLLEHEQLPPEELRWTTDTFLLDRLPQRFDAWGIRDSWPSPVLVRMATDVVLPPGKHRFLMRTRGLSRLWVNDQLIAQGTTVAGSPSGEEPITPVPSPPLPGMRIVEHRQHEEIAEAIIGAEGTCRVILEMLVGGQNFRADPGETCVAVESIEDREFVLLPLGPDRARPLTDGEVEQALARQESSLRNFDDQRRRQAAATQDPFWDKRHHYARDWAKHHAAPAVPDAAGHPIDAFLAAKLQRAMQAAAVTPEAESRQFQETVFPILQEHCFRCHGEKSNGGLKLNSLTAARQGGDSGLPAIVPGSPKQSELLRRIHADDADERMPPGGESLSAEQIASLDAWVAAGAVWPAPPLNKEEVTLTPVLGDAEFLRRVSLDTVGVIPSEAEVREFLQDSAPDKRARLIDRLLADERWADHWMGYWQDVLAENPTLINASLNTTGPFRWFLYDALRDHKSFDRLVTELILLRGSPHEGGSAGFGIAANNDAPFAAKGQILASAFLGIELQCARCHDSPYHSTHQQDLYGLAAMLEQKPVTVPASSRVPAAFFEKKQRESLIRVTMKPDAVIAPHWPFAAETGCQEDEQLEQLMMSPDSSRERLAALITAPEDQRFAQVVANRVWRKFIGTGIVEPPGDWEGHDPSHPELLKWLAHEFISHDYDLKYLSRLILTSDLYQRQARGQQRATSPELRFFTAPDHRRLSAEQIVDSLYAAAGQEMATEELTFDPDGRRPASNRLTLGVPRRAWMFASLANERDRPSLSLPRARTVVDILEAFGWSGSRQNARTDREVAPNVLQPGVLANSAASVILTRAVQGSGLAQLAIDTKSPDQLVDSIFLRYLSRLPTPEERDPLAALLSQGFAARLVPPAEVPPLLPLETLPVVTWSNHLRPEANSIALELEERARSGPAPDPRLQTQWREAYEDVVWSVANLGEFVWIP